MTTSEPVSDIKSSNEVTNGFQQTKDKFLLAFPCIICIDNIVNVGEIYDLLDFGNNGEIVVTKVKFLYAYVTGYRVTILVQYTKTGQLLKRSHRLDNDELACDWVLTDLFTNPDPKDEILNDFHDRN